MKNYDIERGLQATRNAMFQVWKCIKENSRSKDTVRQINLLKFNTRTVSVLVYRTSLKFGNRDN